MNTRQAIRRFWDVFDSHRHFIQQGPGYDDGLFREALNQLRRALRLCSEDLDLGVRHSDQLFFIVRNIGSPRSDALAKAVLDAAPPLAGWQLCWERSWLPDDGFALPEPDFSDPAWISLTRVRLQPVRTAGGPSGFHLWFFMPPSALPEKEEILWVLPLIVREPGFELVHHVHFEPLGEGLPAYTYPFRPVLAWARWINEGILGIWEQSLVGLDEPGLTAPTVPF